MRRFHPTLPVWVLVCLVLFPPWGLRCADAQEAFDVTPSEIESWGFSWDDYQSRVKTRFELLKERSSISRKSNDLFVKVQQYEKIMIKPPKDPGGFQPTAPEYAVPEYNFEYRTDRQLYQDASRDIAYEFFMRRSGAGDKATRMFQRGDRYGQVLEAIDDVNKKLADDIAGSRLRLERLHRRYLALSGSKSGPGNVGGQVDERTVVQSGQKQPLPPRSGDRTSVQPAQGQGSTTQRSTPEDPIMGQGGTTSRTPAAGSQTQRTSPEGPIMGQGGPTVRSAPSPAPTPGPGGGIRSVNDPLAAADWKPIDKPPAPAPPAPGLTETVGPTLTITLMTLESIVNCREQGTPARDCLIQLMVQNGLASSFELAAQLLSAATRIMIVRGVTVLLVIDGVRKTYDILYSLEDWASAEYNAYLAERDHARWTERNVAIRDMPGYIDALRQRIHTTLGPLASSIRDRCPELQRMAEEAKYNADKAEVILQALPEESSVDAMAEQEGKALDAVAAEKVLTTDCDRLKVAFQATAGAADEGMRASARDLISRARDHQAQEAELADVRRNIESAYATLGQIRALSGQSASYDDFTAMAGDITRTKEALQDAAGKLHMEVRGLRRAWPDQMDASWRNELLGLKDLIDSYAATSCMVLEKTHGRGTEGTADVRLDAENRLRPLDALHAILLRLNMGTGARVEAEARTLLDTADASQAAAVSEPAESSGATSDSGVDPEEDDFASLGSAVQSAASEEPDPQDGDETGDGFESLGSEVSATPPRLETVTYFDRDWLPRSWKTSGNAMATRAEIYQTASRLGWAEMLAEYAGPAADRLIGEHILAASGHMERANAASFAPHKAWPDWANRRVNANRWVQRLTTGSASSREYFRKGLKGTLSSEAAALRRQLETVTDRQAGTLANCDSYVFEIGYRLAQASQLQVLALDGLANGRDMAWARRLRNRASSCLASAGTAIQQIRPQPGKQGCADFTPLSQELAKVQARLSTAMEPEAQTVWSNGLALAEGGASAPSCTGELEGYWWSPVGSSYILHWVKNGDSYEGIYERVTGETQQWFRSNTTYQRVRKVGEGTYEGTETRYNYRDRHYYDQALKIRVFSDQYFNGPEGVYHAGYCWKRIAPSDLSRIQTVRQSLGGEILFMPGEKRYHLVEEIEIDCLGKGGSGRPSGANPDSINLLGRESPGVQ